MSKITQEGYVGLSKGTEDDRCNVVVSDDRTKLTDKLWEMYSTDYEKAKQEKTLDFFEEMYSKEDFVRKLFSNLSSPCINMIDQTIFYQANAIQDGEVIRV